MKDFKSAKEKIYINKEEIQKPWKGYFIHFFSNFTGES